MPDFAMLNNVAHALITFYDPGFPKWLQIHYSTGSSSISQVNSQFLLPVMGF